MYNHIHWITDAAVYNQLKTLSSPTTIFMSMYTQHCWQSAWILLLQNFDSETAKTNSQILSHFQGRTQTPNLELARKEHFLYILSHFSIFLHFLPQFGHPGGSPIQETLATPHPHCWKNLEEGKLLPGKFCDIENKKIHKENLLWWREICPAYLDLNIFPGLHSIFTECQALDLEVLKAIGFSHKTLFFS